MARTKLPVDATIRDVLPTLRDADAYVAGVFGHVHNCKRENGNAFVRIGVTGRGMIPHYRVEYDLPGVSYPQPIYDSFKGVNHKQLVDEDALRDEHWSNARMSFGEVEQLLGEVREFKRKKL